MYNRKHFQILAFILPFRRKRLNLTKAWVALGKFLREFVYLAVEICHRWTLLSATPSFQVRKNFENRQKHQRRRSAWVGQADFGKLELNNRNHRKKVRTKKRKMFSGIWRSSVLNVSKQKLLTPTNATLLGWTKSFLFRLRFRIFVVF